MNFSDMAGGEFLRTPFLLYTSGWLGMAATEIRRASFLRIFFFSLGKSALLHRRSLILKFSEILTLVYRKIFSAFYPILHETFSILYKN